MDSKTDLQPNKHYKFDWCIIKSDDTVICYNKDQYVNMNWLRDKEAMMDVEIWIDDIGLLHIESPSKILAELATSKIAIDELEHTPLDRCIKHYKGIKWLGIKAYDYVYGWWYYKSDVPANYILSKYILELK